MVKIKLIRLFAGISRGYWIQFMHGTTLLGLMAGTLTTISFVPQVHKSWHSKRCDDLSWGMLITFSAGVVLWLAYGVLLWAAPIILANAVTLALLITIGCLKARYRDDDGKSETAEPTEIR